MNLKPWTDLTDIERREAIACRIGWTFFGEGACVQHPDYCQDLDGGISSHWHNAVGHIISPQALPDWPTNNNLAFVEVWPKLGSKCMLAFSPSGSRVVYDWDKYYRDDPGPITPTYTWANAICQAAYVLLPEAK